MNFKFQGKIFIILDEKWVKDKSSYGNYSKYNQVYEAV